MARTPRPRLAVEPLEGREIPAAHPAQLVTDAGTFDAGHVLVRWTDGLVHRTFGHGADGIGNGTYRVNLPPTLGVEAAIAQLRARPGVAFAQPDYRVQLTTAPNDPAAGSLWGLDAIHAPQAWNTGTGTGRTVVAVIDSGIAYNHPDLRPNMWVNAREIPGNGRDDDGNGFADDVYGWNFVGNNANVADDNGHGTHVAGTVGAVGNNGTGVAGVSWKVRLMALKFLDASGSGYTSDAIRALNYAVANGAKVVNASFGGGGYDPAMAAAIARARAKGVIVVAAAGNSGTNNDASPEYPANYPGANVVSVAATDRTDRLASFSNYGRSTVDIAAPGVGIYSTLPGGRYGSYSGTSMAAPHVAGALALVWDTHPTWTYQKVIAAVLNTADRVSALAGKVATGRLDVAAAIAYGSDTPTSTPTPTSGQVAGAHVTGVTFAGPGNAINRARVTFSVAMRTNSFNHYKLILTGPDGNTIPITTTRVVPASGQTEFEVRFPRQSGAGTYTLSVGPKVRDLAGRPLDQNRNGVAGEAADRFTGTFTLGGSGTYVATDVGRAIPDRGTVVSRLTIPDAVTIRDLNVRVTARHARTADVRMTLVGPDGTRVLLFNRRGGDGANFAGTLFDDESPNSIWRGSAPFAGSHRSEDRLAAFDGKSAKGTWTLVIEDLFASNTGVLDAWSLMIDGQPAAAAQSVPAGAEGVGAAPLGLPSAPPVEENRFSGPLLASLFVPLTA